MRMTRTAQRPSARRTHAMCLICRGEVRMATIGSLCNRCKDGFSAHFMARPFTATRFAM